MQIQPLAGRLSTAFFLSENIGITGMVCTEVHGSLFRRHSIDIYDRGDTVIHAGTHLSLPRWLTSTASPKANTRPRVLFLTFILIDRCRDTAWLTRLHPCCQISCCMHDRYDRPKDHGYPGTTETFAHAGRLGAWHYPWCRVLFIYPALTMLCY